LATEFKDVIDDTSVSKIEQNTPNYMGYIFTHILWNFWLKYGDVASRVSGFKKLIENTFMTNKDLEDLYIVNAKIGKMWRAFNKIARLWRWKSAKIYNTEDLYMNPIVPGQKNTITIMKNRTKYVFHLKELIGNFNRELSNTCNMFVEPLPCKNPYTNEFFGKSDLYNIYFAIKESTFLMPTLIHEYFLSDFSLSLFMNENEDKIHEFYVDNYTNHMTTDVLLSTIKQMLIEHKINGILIHRDFPKCMLKERMMPYLKLYYISKLSNIKWKKASAYMKLHRMLQDLANDSPSFGRKKFVPTVLNNGKKSYLKYYYEDKIPKICAESLDTYMSSHLDLKIRDTSYLIIHYDIIMSQRRQYITTGSLVNQRYEREEERDEERDEERERLPYISSDSETETQLVHEEEDEEDEEEDDEFIE
jgi:hypothetical protein